MTSQLWQRCGPAERHLRWAAILFAVGWGVHLSDHLRRGMAASPHAVMVGGTIQALFVVVAVLMAVTGRRWAPEAAIAVGIGSAILFTYAHLLPSYLPAYQDSFVSGPRINVTWFSWVSAAAEIGTGIVFAVVGIRARSRASGVGSVVQLRLTAGGVADEHRTTDRHIVFRRSMRNVHAFQGFAAPIRSHRQHSDRTAAEPGHRAAVGHHAGNLLDSVRWLDSSGTVYSGAEAANAALSTALGTRAPLDDLPDSRYPLHRGRRLSVGGRAPVPVPGNDAVLRVTSGGLLSASRRSEHEPGDPVDDVLIAGPSLEAARLHHRDAAAEEHAQHAEGTQAQPPCIRRRNCHTE